MSSFFNYWIVKNLQLHWLLLFPEFPQECFDHQGVINSHVCFLPNNSKTKLGKNWSSFSYAFCSFIHIKWLYLQFLTISLSWQIKTSIWVIKRMTNFKQLKNLLIYVWNIALRTENWKVQISNFARMSG